ncbi:MAG: hypothetical protein MI867_01355 [Pseudomonadales bacterium]|nr:hypothetical protein [Pseudomonadales bacterium]
MNKLIKKSLLATSVLLLVACGGGGSGGGGGSSDDGDDSASLTPPVNFSVTLQSVEVKRISNGDDFSVETEGVNSGALTLQN